MRFDRPISYNGWTSGLAPRAGGLPSSGTLVESIEPARVNSVGYLDKRALQDGLDASDIYLGGRDFRAIVSVFGSTWGDFWDKAQNLLKAFSPTLAYDASSAALGFLPFDFIQPTADTATWAIGSYPYGIPMRYYLRPTAPPLYTLRRDEVGGDETQGLSHRFELNLLARDPRKYLQVQATSDSANLFTHRGDYPTRDATIRVNASTATGTLTISIQGRSVGLVVDTPSAIYDIFLDTRQVAKSGVYAQNLLVGSSLWPKVDPGTATMTTSGLAVQATTLTFREAWA